MEGEQQAPMPFLVGLWLILLAVGLADAWLVTHMNLSFFVSTAIHGTLLALLGANNWALQRDLDSKGRPIEDLQKAEHMQLELIAQLSISNMVLEKQNKILTFKLETLKHRKPPMSKSWSTFPKDDQPI